MSTRRLLRLTLLFNAVYISSIFSIYFVSPVVTGINERYSAWRMCGESDVPSFLPKRLVLIVADGLREDKFYGDYDVDAFPRLADPPPGVVLRGNALERESAARRGRALGGGGAVYGAGMNPEGRKSPHKGVRASERSADADADAETPRMVAAPYLHSLISNNLTSYGVSHTRVPTESRPGHVALIAGMYEDVSAVTKGWKENPVDFDDVFNQSRHSYLFGSPDIVNIFKNDANPGMLTFMYGGHEEDFSKDGVLLDLWVLDQLDAFLSQKKDSHKASQELYLLHLLGTDMTGHAYRPDGPEYFRSIRVVDHVVEKVVDRFNSHYKDDRTVYLFTADHGMGPRGSHGDGSPENTRTPLVVWGSAVARASAPKDVDQADIAALMATLLGINLPANNEGAVPLRYLDVGDASEKYKACAAFANAAQAFHTLHTKTKLKEEHAIHFTPSKDFVGGTPYVDGAESLTDQAIASRAMHIKLLIDAGNYTEAQKHAMQGVRDAFSAIKYIHRYHWMLLRSIVALAYIGFMVHSSIVLVKTYAAVESVKGETASEATDNRYAKIIAACVYFILSSYFAVQHSPFTYYLYAFFPCYFISTIIPGLHELAKTNFFQNSVLPNAPLLFLPIPLQIIVYGYQQRHFFSGLLLTMGWFWPLVQSGRSGPYWKRWRLVCTLLAIFPSLPAEKGESVETIALGGFISVLITSYASDRFGETEKVQKLRSVSVLLKILCGLEFGITAVSILSARSLSSKNGLPYHLQVSGIILLVSSILLLFVHRLPQHERLVDRLAFLFAAFVPSFIILSLSYEILFYIVFCLTLATWIMVEQSITAPPNTLRISVFFLTFVHIGFFGVGNVASISSFYLEPVYRLIPVFDPFAMGALLLFKLLIPFVALSLTMVTIAKVLKLPPMSLFLTASTLSTVLTLNFFFRVSDSGSWLEIGTSITNFVICSFLGIFNASLFVVGEYLLKGVDI